MNLNNSFLIKCRTIIKNILRTLQPQLGVNFKNIEPRLRFTGSYKKSVYFEAQNKNKNLKNIEVKKENIYKP